LNQIVAWGGLCLCPSAAILRLKNGTFWVRTKDRVRVRVRVKVRVEFKVKG
jgi:hypothetical protein